MGEGVAQYREREKEGLDLMALKRDITAEREALQACQRLFGEDAGVTYNQGHGYIEARAWSTLRHGFRLEVLTTGTTQAVAANRLRTCLQALEGTIGNKDPR